jgi:hypothetical protein
MLKFDNPLDTDVDRGDVPIGTAVGGNLLYGGPKYGDVTQEEYDELLKSGKLGRGQQTVELYGEKLLQQASRVYNEVGEYIPDLPGPNETVKKTLSTAKDIVGNVYNWSIRENVEHVTTALGAPVEAAHWISKKVDPTGRGIGKAPLGIAETVLTAGGPAALKGIKGFKNTIRNSDDIFRLFNQADNLAYATVNNSDNLLRSTVSSVVPEPFIPNNIFAATAKETHMAKLPRITTGSKEHTALVKKAQAYGEKHGTMMNFGHHYVDEKGIWRAFNWKKKTKKAGTLDQGGRFDRGVRRSAGVKLDEKTLRKQLGGDEKLFKQYKETNSTIFRKLGKEVEKLNDAGKLKYGNQWERLEVEHIYDVQFFWKLQNEVPNFAGRGANEAINLKILKQRANASTGAAASKLSGSDALVKNLDDFPDYNKAVTEFTDFDMFNTVKKMTTSDWESLTRIVLENPDMNVHEVIVNFF